MERIQNTRTDNNIFATYLREINKIPLLSVEDEVKYAKAAAAGDEKAKKILIESNLRFVVNVAKKYAPLGIRGHFNRIRLCQFNPVLLLFILSVSFEPYKVELNIQTKM